MYLDNTFLQKREIRILSHDVKPGDRRVFYCMNLPILAFAVLGADSTLAISRGPYRPDAVRRTAKMTV